MPDVVHPAHNSGQAFRTSHVVDGYVADVHNVYMPRKRRPPPKPKYSRHFLKEWRKKRGLTQERLAELINMTHASVQRYETRQQPLSQEVLDQLALALRTSRGAILDDPPPED